MPSSASINLSAKTRVWPAIVFRRQKKNQLGDTVVDNHLIISFGNLFNYLFVVQESLTLINAGGGAIIIRHR